MKKTLILLIIFLQFHELLSAQIDRKKYEVRYSHKNIDTVPFIIMAVPKTIENGKSEMARARSSFKRDMYTKLKEEGLSNGYYVYDSTAVLFFVQGIPPGKGPNYEYRVWEDEQVIKPWTSLSKFVDNYLSTSYDNGPWMASLGSYKTGFGKQIGIEVRKKGESLVDAIAIAKWDSITPELEHVYTIHELNDFLKKVQAKEGPDNEFNALYHRMHQEKKQPPLANNFEANENTLIFSFIGTISKKENIEYRLISDQLTTDWKSNQFDFNFIWLQDLAPGNYTLQVRFAFQRHNVTSYKFTIKPAWHQTTTFKIITGSLLAAFIALIILGILYNRQRKKLARELEQKEKNSLALKAIRVQLNPHFIFNALSSIQSLINKQHNEKAGQYLSELGSLMRNTLNSADKESNSLHGEIGILHTYLQLEQLRFGFQYSITTDEAINTSTIQMPSLLLQPLVENAVKHGITDMIETGIVTIHFYREQNNMLVTVKDTGGNYTNHSSEQDGYGLTLTRERIKLLNQEYGEEAITLTIFANKQHTTITLSFKNWLA